MRLPFIIHPTMNMQELQAYIASNISPTSAVLIPAWQIKQNSISSFVVIVED